MPPVEALLAAALAFLLAVAVAKLRNRAHMTIPRSWAYEMQSTVLETVEPDERGTIVSATVEGVEAVS